MSGVFVSGTGTGVGKTWLSRGLARALSDAGHDVRAIKPYETGCDPEPADALALARACRRPELAHAPGMYRERLPLAPWAATRAGGAAPPAIAVTVASIASASQGSDLVLVEGAGGLLVPVDAQHDVADLASALGYPLLLVAANALGCLSHTFTAVESAARRRLPLLGVVLTGAAPDPSGASNAGLLRARLPAPVYELPNTPNDDDALADAVIACGLADRCAPDRLADWCQPGVDEPAS